MKIKIFILLFFPLIGFTQTPSIEIHNLLAIPNYELILVDSVEIPDTIVDLDIAFKVNDIVSADSVFLSIGTTSGGTETISKSYDIIKYQGVYYLYDGNDSIQFYGRNLYLKYEVELDDFADYKFIEVWGKDNAGVLTPKSKFQN